MTGIASNSNLPPDPEILTRAWCLEKTGITDIVGTRIATRLPQNPTLPFLVITNGGGTLLETSSQSAISSHSMIFNCYAGRWGGSGNDKPFADYSTAMSLANAVIQAAFNYSNGYITTSDSNTRAKIYGFEIVQFPTRVEEVSTGLGRYSIALAMTYRAV